jgi:hypothetical protein
MSETIRGNRSRTQFGILIPAILLLGIGSWTLSDAYMASRVAAESRTLEADEATIDVGTFGQGEVAHLRFTLTNHGKQPVKLLRIDPSCGCTKARPSREHIPPGESVTIQADWELGGSRGETSTQLSVAFIEDDAEELEILWLTAVADVQPDIHFQPTQVQFTLGTPAESVVQLIPGRMQEFKVLDAWSSTPGILVQPLVGRREIMVSFDPTGWKPSKRVGQQPLISIKTNSPNEPVINVPIRLDDMQSVLAVSNRTR